MVVFTWDASGLELASGFDRLPQNHAMQRRTFDRVPFFATFDTELDTQPHRRAAEAWGGAITARCFVEYEPIPVFFHALKKVRTNCQSTIQAAASAEQLTVDCIKAGLSSMSLTYERRKVHS